MRKFDPWPVFFRREFNRNWPFLVGFAVTGTIITKLSLGLTEEDAKNSTFVQRHKKLVFGRLTVISSAFFTDLPLFSSPRLQSLANTLLFLSNRQASNKMITDGDLGFIANFLGIFIFALVIAYHYVLADPKYEGN
ncbi:hypothetical protein SSX86_016844 [Deinandra increscens subsp. villosa]|uniref:Dolichyl-diphosphooligosaccharide--protein glycosyltransferase subunit 4 n=1 Tax=Deinandra increscens subsp. villosa TaxID=3103831 RepID=A0AAP0CU57_9ASTR